MDQYLLLAWAWLQANPMTTALLVYLAVNIIPRLPPPKNPVLFVLWDLVEKLMFLTRDKLPGNFKPLLERELPGGLQTEVPLGRDKNGS